MPRPNGKQIAAAIERLLDEASWLLSHAQALADYGRSGEALTELARAATCEEDVACLLEANAQEREAAIHRVSAASCHEKIGAYPRAVTLLSAALAADLPGEFRTAAQKQHLRCLTAARKELGTAHRPRKRQSAAS